MMGMDYGLDIGNDLDMAKEEKLKTLIKEMYKLMAKQGDEESMVPEPEGEEGLDPMEGMDPMEGAEEMPEMEAEGGEDDGLKNEMLDFMSGKKPPEKSEGMAMVISSKLSGKGKKKRGRKKKA